MVNGEIRVSEGDESENGEVILNSLPPWMPTDPSSGNFKLLDVVGRAFDRFEGDLNDVDNASSVQEAETVEQIARLAKILQLAPKEGEAIEKYRTRTISEFQTLTSEGTISDLINNTSIILDTDSSNIGYQKMDENGVVKLGLPGAALNELSITGDELINVITKNSPAGYRVEASIRGTFTHMTPSDYQNGNNESSKGYDGLDSNGNPMDSGGTYAGLL